jgi:hypothetical protein
MIFKKWFGVITLVALFGFLLLTCVDPEKEENKTPVASDYTIGNLIQTAGNVTAVTITPLAGRSPGKRTIWYEGNSGTVYTRSTTIPQTAGTYTITFDVASATGWNGVPDLPGGTLVVNGHLNIFLRIEQIIDGEPIFDAITLSRTNSGGFPSTRTVSINASDYDPGSIHWEIAGVGFYSDQFVTGSGASFTLSALEIKYNSLGGHTLILSVSKNSIPYQRAIPFIIVQ